VLDPLPSNGFKAASTSLFTSDYFTGFILFFALTLHKTFAMSRTGVFLKEKLQISGFVQFGTMGFKLDVA